MRRSIRSFFTVALFAVGTATVTVAALWPRTTHAEAVADWDRQGEWDDDGMRFGDIVIKGELVADGNGWVLVRTVENKSDAPATCRLEERVMRTETMPDARVNPPSTALVLRGVVLTLAAHEKRTIGIPLAASVGSQMTAALRDRASIEKARAWAIEHEKYSIPTFQRTYMIFDVEYLTPLPPGATAAKQDTGVTRPMAMPLGAL